MRKLFSSPAIQFKGSGFYITDYAKKDQAPASAEGEAKSDTASKDKDAGEKSGDKGEKSEKGEKAEKSDKSEKASPGDKTSAKTDAAPASPSKAPAAKKEGT